MCAARVEVLKDQVIAKNLDKIVGQGQGIYRLRDYDRKLDSPSYYSSPEDTYCLDFDLGADIGSARVRTDTHDTAVEVTAARVSVGLGTSRNFSSSCTIFDESYGYGRPSPVEITDGEGNPLIRVSHLSTRKKSK